MSLLVPPIISVIGGVLTVVFTAVTVIDLRPATPSPPEPGCGNGHSKRCQTAGLAPCWVMSTHLITHRPSLTPIPHPWEEPIEHLEFALRAQGTRESSISTRIRHIRRLARDLDPTTPTELTADELIAWAGQQTWAPETRHSYYNSIRVFYTALNLRTSNPADALPSVKRPVPPPRPTPETVYTTALTRADARTRFILRMAGEAGLRRTEIAQIHADDLISDPTGHSLTIHGKGGHARQVPLTDEITALIRHHLRTSPTDWALPSRNGGHIQPHWVAKLASRVLPTNWSLHTLRHRFATRAYAQDRDILAVQRLLGHTSVTTTQRYTDPPIDALRQAVTAATPNSRANSS